MKDEPNTQPNVDEDIDTEIEDVDDDDESWIADAQKEADELYNNNPDSWITVKVLSREESAARHGGGYTILKSRKPGDNKA